MPTTWIFGYGSLIWKVDFPFARRIAGYITGFNRRFYQHSIDHRGTEEKPGRVVTLIPAEKDTRVFGMAYEIEDTVMSHLDFREKNGYERFNVQFFPLEDHQDKATQHSDPFDLTVYVATESNVSFAGPKAIPELAKQVIEATGPSGRNRDYVYNLADAIRELFPGEDDPHLFALEAEVKRLEKEAEAKGVRSI